MPPNLHSDSNYPCLEQIYMIPKTFEPLKFYCIYSKHCRVLGPVVQSVVSLTSSLVVKMLTVLVSTIPKSRVFLLKMWVAFANAKATHIFSKNISIYAIFNDQSFNDTLINDIVSFEQLSSGQYGLSSSSPTTSFDLVKKLTFCVNDVA